MVKKAVIIGLLLVVVLTSVGLGREIVVTSTADSGTGSFRWALQMARSGDVITFDPAVFPPEDPATIYPRNELPPIHCGNLTIDASNAGVIIDGTRVPGDWNNGLQVYSDRNTVMGLQIVNFIGCGIAVCLGSYNTIGGNRSIGARLTGQGNLVSGNNIGVDICDVGTSHNMILGNLIGTNVNGTAAWGNRERGIWIEEGVDNNMIGPGNIIAFSGSYGIEVLGSNSIGNTIFQNSIHNNGRLGIYLVGGGNAQLDAPIILDFDMHTGTVAGTACSSCAVEVFSDSGMEGEVYEGRTDADEFGLFSFSNGSPLSGPHLTATATDTDGNTSAFSTPTLDIAETPLLQEENDLLRISVQYKRAKDLEDNRIGPLWTGFPEPCDYEEFTDQEVSVLGAKQAIFAINNCDFDKIDWDISESLTNECQDALVTEITNSDVTIRYRLTFWDKEAHARGEEISYPRFKTEDQIEHYLDFVRFIVHHFKNRIEYYELWGEPTIENTLQWIEVDDYIKLVKRVVSVIHEEYPEGKVVVGATDYLIYPKSREYLFAILQSDIMSLVDGVSWHPMYGTSPQYTFHRAYYYEYPSIVREIKEIASDHGFGGEYFADELTWGILGTHDIYDPTVPWPMTYPPIVAAKYLARGIVMHLGMDVSVVTPGCMSGQMPMSYSTVRNLCTLMAGHEAIDMPVQINIDYSPAAYCAFRYSNGDRMLAVWTDGVAQDEDPGVSATITFPGLTAEKVVGIDVLHGFEQELLFEVEDGSTIVRDLIIKDYPILIRFSDVTLGPDYEEIVGDGFHRLGDVDAVPSNSGGSDRDGDGVPDDEDYCPDWPGSKEANGC